MKTTRLALLSICLSCSVPVHAANWLASQITYEAEGWTVGQAYGLNNLGQVIGMMQPAGPRPPYGIFESVPMGFVTGANGKDLRPVDPDYMPYVEYCHGCHTAFTPRAINNTGQIAVTTFSPWTQEVSLLLAGPGGGAISPPPGVIGAWGAIVSLNNSGQLAATFAHGPPSSFVTDSNGSNPHLLGILDNNYDNILLGINDSGQLLISGVRVGSTEITTFVTEPNASDIAFEVGSFGHSSFVNGLNNSGQLFGGYYATAGGQQRAFITDANGAGFTDLGSLGGNTYAFAINNNGLVVGDSGGKPFLYGLGKGIIDLNQLIALSPGEFLTYAPDINDRGQIVAQSNLGNLYLLSPVPEPTTYLMLLSGLALIYWRTRPQPMSFT